MTTKLASILDELSKDKQVAAAEAAAAGQKVAHQPEMGMPPGGMTRSPMDGMIGNTAHDQRARAEELALEQAGRQLEANTFDDAREEANARNLANVATDEVRSPTDEGRQDTYPGNKMLAESPAQKMAAAGKCGKCAKAPCTCKTAKCASLSFAQYVEKCAEGDEGVKTASQALDADVLREYQKTATLYYAKGANMALGHIAEAIGA